MAFLVLKFFKILQNVKTPFVFSILYPIYSLATSNSLSPTNIENTMSAVTSAIEAAELMGGCEVHSCYVGIGSTQVESLNSKGQVSVANKSREIGRNDINRVIECASNVAVPLDRKVLHVVPQIYTVEHSVDCVQKTKDPTNIILNGEYLSPKKPMIS